MDTRSENNLKNVHPDLIKIVRRVYQDFPCFIVTEGARTVARQKQLVAAGASQTMNSRHIIASNGYAHAVDLAATVNGKVRWDWPLYKKLADCMKGAAAEFKIPVEWGGDWKSFKDGPHFQLPFSKYPK
jgi:peptidoglycan L-alanyl-D-glutamate endopeptidase CwlK